MDTYKGFTIVHADQAQQVQPSMRAYQGYVVFSGTRMICDGLLTVTQAKRIIDTDLVQGQK